MPVYIQMLVQGNMNKEEAIDIFETTANTFNATADISSDFNFPDIAIKRIPNEGTKVVRIDEENQIRKGTFDSIGYI